jgi:glycosyltransferase involved in cell wall biosynthesis
LWCLGKGELDDEFPKHEKIKNFGFVQPSELRYCIENTGVLILPAHYEHWGVVVHEFAAAGFPLVCSTTTGAATTFLKDGFNGFFHEPYKVKDIYNAMKKIISLPDEKLFEMGVNSTVMAKKITPDTWANTILKLIHDKS